MLLATTLGFAGYSLLLPVVPLRVAAAGEFAAGVTTGVLMATTILTQLAVPWLVARTGYRTVFAAGLVLLGAPAPLLALSAELAPVLLVSALRGVGFGLLTVVGSALVAELVEPAERGRAAARYGIAVGLPQLVLLPSGVAVVGLTGFTGVFVAAGVAPLLGLLALPALRVPERPAPPEGPVPVAGAAPARRGPLAVAPLVAMLTCSIAQGGLITFLPLAVPDAALLVAGALFVTAAGTLLGRSAAGWLVDRRGLGGRLLVPGVLLAAVGAGVEVVALGDGAAALVVVGAALVGIGFGLVQNDALTALFAAGGPERYGAASAAWNIAYDAGTGAGAVGLGAVADPLGFRAAFGLAALLLVVAAPVVRPRRRSAA
jgi:MFS family permease